MGHESALPGQGYGTTLQTFFRNKTWQSALSHLRLETAACWVTLLWPSEEEREEKRNQRTAVWDCMRLKYEKTQEEVWVKPLKSGEAERAARSQDVRWWLTGRAADRDTKREHFLRLFSVSCKAQVISAERRFVRITHFDFQGRKEELKAKQHRKHKAAFPVPEHLQHAEENIKQLRLVQRLSGPELRLSGRCCTSSSKHKSAFHFYSR